MAKNGNIFIVTLGGTQIAGAKSDDIEVKCDLQEVASPSQGDWREFLAGRKEWTVNTSYLVSSGGDLAKMLNVGTKYLLSFYDRQSYNELRGYAILTTCKVQATKGNLTTGVFQFQGTGILQFLNP